MDLPNEDVIIIDEGSDSETSDYGLIDVDEDDYSDGDDDSSSDSFSQHTSNNDDLVNFNSTHHYPSDEPLINKHHYPSDEPLVNKPSIDYSAGTNSKLGKLANDQLEETDSDDDDDDDSDSDSGDDCCLIID
ncbi:hypothetical protein ACFE04_027403 [Oxalis oulophora]